jgi:hypothetical protein
MCGCRTLLGKDWAKGNELKAAIHWFEAPLAQAAME